MARKFKKMLPKLKKMKIMRKCAKKYRKANCNGKKTETAKAACVAAAGKSYTRCTAFVPCAINHMKAAMTCKKRYKDIAKTLHKGEHITEDSHINTTGSCFSNALHSMNKCVKKVKAQTQWKVTHPPTKAEKMAKMKKMFAKMKM